MDKEHFSVYQGDAPFIFLSYSPEDREEVFGMIRSLEHRGVRFWLGEGIAPGFERDEVIARKILECDYFIAFVSPHYLGALDETDELNYARDVNKPLTLVFLRELTLPSGMAMRMTRTQNLERWRMSSDAELANCLLEDQGMARFYGIADPDLASRAAKLFDRLESYYPDHGVFALDGLDEHLSEELTSLCTKTEFDSVDEMFRAYGYRKVSAAEAIAARGGIRYSVGSEPELIHSRLDSALSRLKALYPSGIIPDSIARRNATLARRVTALSQWLGYPSTPDFLQAYGMTCLYEASAGRTQLDHQKLIEQLQAIYASPGRARPGSISQLRMEQPELSGAIKTLQNTAYERFGCTLKDYFFQIGLLARRSDEKGESCGKLHLQAVEALRQRRETSGSDNAELTEALQGLTLRQYQGGDIYVYRADDCAEHIILPEGIDGIRAGAFSGQTELQEIELPAGLRVIEENAFAGCAALKSVRFSEGLEVIGKHTFENCVSLTSVALPGSLRVVRQAAFSGCLGLKDVSLANHYTVVYDGAFAGCPWTPSADEAATDPALFECSVDKKNRAKITGFHGDPEQLVVPDMLLGHPVSSIEKGAFAGLTSLRSVIIGDQIGAIASEAFAGCAALEQVHLPNALPKFVSTVFSGCSSVREINIPNAMTELKRGQFRDLPIETLYIGAGLTALDGDAFYKGEMDPVTGVQIRGKTIRDVVIDPENHALSASGTMILSADGKTVYAELGDPESVIVPDGVECIAASAFAKSRRLVSASLPSTLREIGDHAFEETALRELELPGSLRSIGEAAFMSCRGLETAILPEGLERIGAQAFAYCPLKEIFLPASLSELGENAFALFSMYQGEAPQRVHIPLDSKVFHTDDSVLYGIQDGKRVLLKAFDYSFRDPAAAPQSCTVEAGTERIAPYAFARCAGLTSIVLPDTLQEIGSRAFLDCAALTEIVGLRDELKIEPFAFQFSGMES